jgi:hypothetical protein
MNEEIEYAQMLEIPVSTVNVVRKKRKVKKEKPQEKSPAFAPVSQTSACQNQGNLKDSVIEKVNGKMENGVQENYIQADAQLFAESANSLGSLDFSDIPERIDTTRLYKENERPTFDDAFALNDSPFSLFGEEMENDGGRYEMKEETRSQKLTRKILGGEFIAACVLCGGIFFTNVFMPTSAMNTFFRAIHANDTNASTEARSYADFTLSGVLSDFSSAELTLSPTGILSLNDECHVYPVADGKVETLTQNADGSYTVKIAHSDSFKGVISGLEQVYYAEGESVKANVPLGFSGGDMEVQVTMYNEGVLLNCFELTEENALAWVEKE